MNLVKFINAPESLNYPELFLACRVTLFFVIQIISRLHHGFSHTFTVCPVFGSTTINMQGMCTDTIATYILYFKKVFGCAESKSGYLSILLCSSFNYYKASTINHDKTCSQNFTQILNFNIDTIFCNSCMFLWVYDWRFS